MNQNAPITNTETESAGSFHHVGPIPTPLLFICKFLAWALCILGIPISASSANDHHDKDEKFGKSKVVAVAAGEVLNQDYFAFGESIEISGRVKGDVYALGGNVLVDGTIDGDLLVGGGTVTISGTIVQDVRVAGGHVIISGRIGRNATIGSGNIDFTPSGRIQGGLVAGSGKVHLAGLIEGNAVVGAGNLVVSHSINGSLKAAAGSIRLTSQAQVAKDFTYWSHRRASIDHQARISGLVTKHALPKEFFPSPKDLAMSLVGLILVLKLASFISTLVLGLLLIRFYPKFIRRGIHNLQHESLKVLGLGFLILFLTPVVIFLLGITVIGLPMAAVVLALLLLYLYLARIMVIAWAGQRLFAWIGKCQYEKWSFAAGLMMYSLLTLFPVFGQVVTFLTVLFGLGTLSLTQKEIYGEMRNQDMI
jgi:cytoskeletal protein CcmA (bactofilin family)